MGRAKDVVVKVIPSKLANDFIRKHHYSGKVVNNSCLHFGAFLDGGLHGVMSYGPSLDKKKIIGLVEGTGWNEFLELNRMAFDDYLTMIKPNEGLLQMPDGSVVHQLSIQSQPMSPRPELGGKSLFELTGGTYSIKEYCKATGAVPKQGFQLRYIYFIDPTCREKLTVPIIPFERIDELGAGMYKGQQISRQDRHVSKSD